MGSPLFDDRGISKKTGGKRQIMEVNKMDKNAKHYPLNVTMPQHCAYVVRDLPQATVEQRERALNATHWNEFAFPSGMLTVDMLSDSGTTAMTNQQWATLFLGDEAYGRNTGYYVLLDTFRDIFEIVRIKGFWYIAILCVLFYSAVFPFLKYAPDLMFNKFGISEKLSGIIPALLPFGTILLTPFFGNLYDRRGKGATIMLVGSFMIVAVHLLFAVPAFTNWLLALVLIITLGIAFSLVPSAMWPSVPKIIPENKLGTAYALIFWIQNWGLMGVPYLIGKVLDNYCVVDNATTVAEEITGVVAPETVTRVAYDYTVPMLIFAGLGVLSILFAFLLLRENKKMGYGLQQPNIRK
jgi:nitrate/nitrite transporter NarK